MYYRLVMHGKSNIKKIRLLSAAFHVVRDLLEFNFGLNLN